MNAFNVLGVLVSFIGFSVAAWSLARLSAKRRAERRDSFTELLDQAEAERIRLQVEADAEADEARLEAQTKGEQIPWR